MYPSGRRRSRYSAIDLYDTLYWRSWQRYTSWIFCEQVDVFPPRFPIEPAQHLFSWNEYTPYQCTHSFTLIGWRSLVNFDSRFRVIWYLSLTTQDIRICKLSLGRLLFIILPFILCIYHSYYLLLVFIFIFLCSFTLFFISIFVYLSTIKVDCKLLFTYGDTR